MGEREMWLRGRRSSQPGNADSLAIPAPRLAIPTGPRPDPRPGRIFPFRCCPSGLGRPLLRTQRLRILATHARRLCSFGLPASRFHSSHQWHRHQTSPAQERWVLPRFLLLVVPVAIPIRNQGRKFISEESARRNISAPKSADGPPLTRQTDAMHTPRKRRCLPAAARPTGLSTRTASRPGWTRKGDLVGTSTMMRHSNRDRVHIAA